MDYWQDCDQKQSSQYAVQVRLNGSGVAAGDVDGDGRCDLYLCALGGGVPLPIKNALHYFRDELQPYFTASLSLP